jgi:hypothetical protein
MTQRRNVRAGMEIKVITKAQNLSFAKAQDLNHADHIFDK